MKAFPKLYKKSDGLQVQLCWVGARRHEIRMILILTKLGILRFFGNFGGVKTDEFLAKRGGHANPNEFRCKISGLPKKRNIVFRK